MNWLIIMLVSVPTAVALYYMAKAKQRSHKEIIVKVEMDNGNVHQVLASKQQKEVALHMMKNEKRGALMLSEEVEPIELEFKDE